MSINNLPIELLEHIISFLSSSERLKSTLISRRFAQAFNESPRNDTWLVVRADLVDEAKAIMSNSTRQYKNIRICKADPLEFNSIVWTKLGISLRQLEFNDCRFGSSGVLYSILHACPSLESLAIHDSENDASMWGQWLELPSGINLQDIQDATHKLSHLHLGFYVNADTLENMLVAMPNVSTISVSRFEQKSDFLNRIRGLLGTRRRITRIDWEPDVDPEIKMDQLLSIAYTTLEEVRIPSALPGREVYEELKRCTKLRFLEIMLNEETILHSIVQGILDNTKELEVLKLASDRSDICYEDPDDIPLSHEAIMPILELTKLRELRLDLYLRTQHDHRPVEDFVRGLGQLSSLECLHLSRGIGLIGHTCLQNLATLPNLQDLTLDYSGWDANCLRTITFDFKNLRRLSIKSYFEFRAVDFQESERKVLDVAIHPGSDPRGERIKSSRLETLEMWAVPITDVGLTCIAACHSQLKDLKLSICRNITDAGLVNLLKKEPLLEKLKLEFFNSTDGSFLDAFEDLCPQLRHLQIESCRNIRSSAVELFKSQRPTVLLEILPSY